MNVHFVQYTAEGQTVLQDYEYPVYAALVAQGSSGSSSVRRLYNSELGLSVEVHGRSLELDQYGHLKSGFIDAITFKHAVDGTSVTVATVGSDQGYGLGVSVDLALRALRAGDDRYLGMFKDWDIDLDMRAVAKAAGESHTPAYQQPFIGGLGDDTAHGSSNNDIVFGYEGDDHLDGNGGADFLLGGAGKDSLSGGAGIDWLDGGSGTDRLDGGSGSDWVMFSLGDDMQVNTAAVKVDLAAHTAAGLGTDTLTSIENAIGAKGKDFIFGDRGANMLEGGEGNDTIDGRGDDDTMAGGAGKDILTGGTGHDRFVFTDKSLDRLVDFSASKDTLVLDRAAFSELGASVTAGELVAGNVALDKKDHLLFRAGHDGVESQLWYDADGSGGGKAVLIATLPTDVVLSASDFKVADTTIADFWS